jgi:hypothetical protein
MELNPQRPNVPTLEAVFNWFADQILMSSAIGTVAVCVYMKLWNASVV